MTLRWKVYFKLEKYAARLSISASLSGLAIGDIIGSDRLPSRKAFITGTGSRLRFTGSSITTSHAYIGGYQQQAGHGAYNNFFHLNILRNNSRPRNWCYFRRPGRACKLTLLKLINFFDISLLDAHSGIGTGSKNA
jgi:hypothetical protein